MNLKHKKIVSIVLNNFINDFRVRKECLSLQKVGADVQVVALHDKSLPEKEIVHGIPISRIRLKTRGLTKNRIVQLIKYFEFVFHVIKMHRKADIYHCNDLNALPVGVIIKKFFNKNARVVYDAHEYETERNGSRKLEKPFMRWLESVLIRHADRFITVSDSIAREYARLYNIEKPNLVLNCPPNQSVSRQNKFRESLGIRQNQTIFLYQGGLSGGRGIAIILDAFLMSENDKNVVVFMGSGPLEAQIKEKAKGSMTVFFYPAVAPEVLLNYTASADFGILFYENTCLNHYYCSPNKIFEYFMAGLPVIVSNLFEMKFLVEKYKVGVVAENTTPKSLLSSINKICSLDYNQLIKNVRKTSNIFNWEAQVKILLKVYKELN